MERAQENERISDNESRVAFDGKGGEEDRQQLIRASSVPNTVETNASGPEMCESDKEEEDVLDRDTNAYATARMGFIVGRNCQRNTRQKYSNRAIHNYRGSWPIVSVDMAGCVLRKASS